MTAYPLIAPGAARPPSGFFQYAWLGHEWDDLSAKSPWSITSPDNGASMRLELRRGDQTAFDRSAGSGSERSEICASYDGMYQTPKGPGRVPIRTVTRAKYGLTIEAGAPNTASWFVLTQFHEDEVGPASPPVSLQLVGEKLSIWIGYTRPDGTNTNGPIWTDSDPIVRGRRYLIEQFMYVDPNGQGRLQVYRDGIKLVDYRGTIGYAGQTNSFWAWCVYRHGPTPETIAVVYDSAVFEWGGAVAFPPDVTAALGKVTGPFVNDQGSWRAAVVGKVPATPASATLNGQVFANLTVQADGSYSASPIRVTADGTPSKLVVTSGGMSASLTLTGSSAGVTAA